MTVEEYLGRYRKLDIQIGQLRSQIEELITTLTGVTVDPSKEFVDGSGGADKFSLIDDLIRIEEELGRKLIEATVLKGQITLQIQSLDDPRYVWVLYRRYVDLMKWEEIAPHDPRKALPPFFPAYDTAKKWHTEAKKAFAEKFGTQIHTLM